MKKLKQFRKKQIATNSYNAMLIITAAAPSFCDKLLEIPVVTVTFRQIC
jgi:hypothetical protein